MSEAQTQQPRPARPTRRFRAAVWIMIPLVGMMAGVGAFTLVYADGAAYLTNDPRACTNCHVMQGQYDAWIKSPHRSVATCNDCHTPHDFLGKYLTKARNGFHHSLAFTTGNFHEPIMIGAANRSVTEGACRHCHEPIVQAIDAAGAHRGQPLDCIRCHADVGHATE